MMMIVSAQMSKVESLSRNRFMCPSMPKISHNSRSALCRWSIVASASVYVCVCGQLQVVLINDLNNGILEFFRAEIFTIA